MPLQYLQYGRFPYTDVVCKAGCFEVSENLKLQDGGRQSTLKSLRKVGCAQGRQPVVQKLLCC